MLFKLAVVGKNISYSKSPFIHAEFGKALGIPVDYTIQDVGEGHFEAKISALQQAGFAGCNITLPYKEAAFALADEISPRALKVGAANTFVFRAEDFIFADNTDGQGFVRDVTQNIGFSLAKKRILICGAGGAAQGILASIIENAPTEIIIVNRTFAKAQDLAHLWQDSHIAILAHTYKALAGQTFDVVIDATSLKTETLPLPDSVKLNAHALVYDLKYSPEAKTAMMQWGKTKGAEHIHDGIGMLVEQAAESFALWTGKIPETHPVLSKLKALYQNS